MKNLLFIISILSIISCNSVTNKAIIYNNKLLNEYVSISDEMNSYLDIIRDTSHSTSSIQQKRKLLEQIEQSISTLNTLGDFNGNISFNKSVVLVLNAYSEGIKNEYNAIALYQTIPDSEKTSQKRWEAEQHVIHADEEITKAEDYFILKQKEFAKENNFNLD